MPGSLAELSKIPETGDSAARGSRWRAWRQTAGTNLLNGILIAALVLGLWRAIALGANGVAAASLMLSAAGLLITICAFNRAISAWALVIAAVIAGPLGWAGKGHFANEPVDVASSCSGQWRGGPENRSPTSTPPC
jgi:hypothetical protein